MQQIFPHEYRRALDEASKLKAAQKQQAALLAEVRRKRAFVALPACVHVPQVLALVAQADEEDAFERLKTMALGGKRGIDSVNVMRCSRYLRGKTHLVHS